MNYLDLFSGTGSWKKVIGSNVKPKPMLESVGRQRPYSNKKIY
jgi:hypothetical protein